MSSEQPPNERRAAPHAGRPRGAAWRELQAEGIEWEGQILIGEEEEHGLSARLIITSQRLAFARGGEVVLGIERSWLKREPYLSGNGAVNLRIETPSGHRERLPFIARDGRLAATDIVMILTEGAAALPVAPLDPVFTEVPERSASRRRPAQDSISEPASPPRRDDHKYAADLIDASTLQILDPTDFPPVTEASAPSTNRDNQPNGGRYSAEAITISTLGNQHHRQGEWTLDPLRTATPTSSRGNRAGWAFRLSGLIVLIALAAAFGAGQLPDASDLRDRGGSIIAPGTTATSEVAINLPTATVPIADGLNAATRSAAETAAAIGIGGETVVATEAPEATATPVLMTPVPTRTASSTATETATPTTEPTATETAEPTATETAAPSATETEPAEAIATATAISPWLPTSTDSATASETPEPTATDTATSEPTATDTAVPTATATLEPTATTEPTVTATATPEPTATVFVPAEESPTAIVVPPTELPTLEPTATTAPTEAPTQDPTDEPTATATAEATIAPTETATAELTTTEPTATATAEPTATATPGFPAQERTVGNDETPDQVFSTGNFRYTVEYAVRGAEVPTLDLAPTATGDWVVIVLYARNWTEEAATLNMADFQLLVYDDSFGYQFLGLDASSPEIARFLGLDPVLGTSELSSIAAGEGIRLALVYQVPTATSDIELVDDLSGLNLGQSLETGGDVTSLGGAPERPDLIEAVVTEVIDGRTIVVEADGFSATVQYLGVTVPTGAQCYAAEATTTNSNIVLGETVYLERQFRNRVSSSGEAIARDVWIDNTQGGLVLVSAWLASEGAAVPAPADQDVRFSGWIQAAADAAQGNGAGFWAACGGPPVAANGADTLFSTETGIEPLNRTDGFLF